MRVPRITSLIASAVVGIERQNTAKAHASNMRVREIYGISTHPCIAFDRCSTGELPHRANWDAGLTLMKAPRTYWWVLQI